MNGDKSISINKTLLWGVIVLGVLALVVAGIFIGRSVTSSNSYYAVYLNTGDLYFGKLSRTPSLSLSDVWYLQRSKEGGKLSMNKFSNAVWGPSDKMEINKDKIVWMTKLKKDSKVIPLLDGSSPQQTQTQPVKGNTTNTNNKGAGNTSK